jgi:hypothetical protein
VSSRYETQYAWRPVCTHCGHEHDDGWEWNVDEHGTEVECESCEKSFICTRIVSVEYCTEKISPTKGGAA